MNEPENLPILRANVSTALEWAKAVEVVDGASYGEAAAGLTRIVAGIRGVKQAFAEPKRLAHEAHKAIAKLESSLLVGFEEAEKITKREMSAYKENERLILLREQRELEAQAKRLEEDRVLERAQALENDGQHEAAERLIEQPVAAPVVKIEGVKADGVHERESWDFEITDLKAIDRAFLAPDLSKIRSIVKALGPDAEKRVGGIRVRKVTTIVARGSL